MSKIKNGGLDQHGAEPYEVTNSSNLEQLALKGLNKAQASPFLGANRLGGGRPPARWGLNWAKTDIEGN